MLMISGKKFVVVQGILLVSVILAILNLMWLSGLAGGVGITLFLNRPAGRKRKEETLSRGGYPIREEA